MDGGAVHLCCVVCPRCRPASSATAPLLFSFTRHLAFRTSPILPLRANPCFGSTGPIYALAHSFLLSSRAGPSPRRMRGTEDGKGVRVGDRWSGGRRCTAMKRAVWHTSFLFDVWVGWANSGTCSAFSRYLRFFCSDTLAHLLAALPSLSLSRSSSLPWACTSQRFPLLAASLCSPLALSCLPRYARLQWTSFISAGAAAAAAAACIWRRLGVFACFSFFRFVAGEGCFSLSPSFG